MAEIIFGVVVAITALAIALAVRAARERQRKALDRLRSSSDETRELPAVAPPPVGAIPRFNDWFERTIRRSDLDASPEGVVAGMLLAATVLGSAMYFWKGFLWLTGLAAMAGILVPFGVVVYYHRRYRKQLQQQLPVAYRMMAGSVRAGQTLEQAIAFYGERGNKPLAPEFAYCAGLIKLGMTPVAALRSTATRVRLLDFDLLVSTVGLYTQTGGNLVLLLERLADSVWDRNQFAGQFAAATAQARAVAVSIASASPLLLLYYALAEPEHVVNFFSTLRGWAILAVCLVTEGIGLIWIRGILKIE